MGSNGPAIHLVDNDFLIKLARWDLLDDYLEAFEIDVINVRAIISLKTRLYLAPGKPNLKLVGTAVAAERLKPFLATVKAPVPIDHNFSQQATGVPDFEAGEVVLVSALCAGAGECFYTGDKRAIRALATFKDTEFDKKIRGRVLCLEQALLVIIDKLGFAYVRDKISVDLAADGTIANIFVGAGQTPPDTVRNSLKSEIQKLHDSCGHILKI